MKDYIDEMNKSRKANGYKTIDEVIDLAQTNTVFDLFSVLISGTVSVGDGNIFYPNVLIQNIGGKISIGQNNTFFGGTRIISEYGEIFVGNDNEIGENSISIKSNKSQITIKNECRLMGGAQITDDCYLGNGSQVLGNIKMAKCILSDGKSYREKNPNNRGGVIKGYGIASSLKIDIGMVISGNGKFSIDDIILQEKNHPDWMTEAH